MKPISRSRLLAFILAAGASFTALGFYTKEVVLVGTLDQIGKYVVTIKSGNSKIRVPKGSIRDSDHQAFKPGQKVVARVRPEMLIKMNQQRSR